MHAHAAPDVAAPVPRQRERSVDAGRGDLERVGVVPHRVGGIEGIGHGTAGRGDPVQIDAAIAVDDDAHAPAPAGCLHVEFLEIESEGGHDRLQQGTHVAA